MKIRRLPTRSIVYMETTDIWREDFQCLFGIIKTGNSHESVDTGNKDTDGARVGEADGAEQNRGICVPLRSAKRVKV